MIKGNVHMMLTEYSLTIVPSNADVERFLTIEVKCLEQDPARPWITKSTKKRKRVFKMVREEGPRVVQTMQGFWLGLKNFLEGKGYTVKLDDLRKEFVAPRLDLMHGFRYSQEALLTEFLSKNMSGLLGAPTRYGKCWSPGTGILMYDGTIRKVEDVVNGDLVMGHDSAPRKVTGCISGYDTMYTITPNKGEPFTVTEDHILVLKRTNEGRRKTARITKGGMTRSPNKDGKEYLITVKDYAASSKTYKHLHKLVSRPVSFEAAEVIMDPYCYGLWLGDGTTDHANLTTLDYACARAWLLECRRLGMSYRVVKQKNTKARTYCIIGYKAGQPKLCRNNKLLTLLQQSSLGGKHILSEYKINSYETRLGVLAGIIDSDGYNNNGFCISITFKSEKLIKDTQFLARSLGFRFTYGIKKFKLSDGRPYICYCGNISGDLKSIPTRLKRKQSNPKQRVNPLVTGFTVTKQGTGEFYGFEVEGPDKLILMENFMVTHNTTLIKNTLKAYSGLTTVVTAPGADLVTQLYKDIKEELPHREVKLIGAGSKVQYPSEDITVISMDSMDKADFGRTELLIIDEPHAAVTDSRLPILNSFQKARRLGFGATLHGRYDGKDALITGLIGPVLAERTYTEAVAEGAICPLKVYMLRIPVHARSAKTSWNRTQAYKNLLFESPKMAEIADKLCKQLIPDGWQTLIFIKNEKQADLYLKYIGEAGTIAMAKKLTAKQRKEIMERMRGDDIKRCIASDIYSQGVTFNHVRVMINMSGGGNNATTIQKPGRLAEVREGKKAGVIIDFAFYPADGLNMQNCGEGLRMMFVDSNSRRKAYTDKGYEVIDVSSFDELAALTADVLV